MARFGDNSDSTILKFLKFLIPYSAAIIKVWLDKTFVYFNCSVHWNKWPDPLKSTYTRGYFFRDFMNLGLPREMFVNDKPERFALIALVYWDAVYMDSSPAKNVYACSSKNDTWSISGNVIGSESKMPAKCSEERSVGSFFWQWQCCNLLPL